MELGLRKHIRTTLLLTCVIFNIQCSHRDGGGPANNGGQGTGGGSVFYSSKEQVGAALDHALSLATETDPQKNIFVQFWLDRGQKSQRPFIRSPQHIFPKIDEKPQSSPPDSVKNTDQFESPFLQALKRNKITRLDAGDCLNSQIEKHKDAAVSAFNVNADICFSIGNLTRIPPSTLLREVLSLVLHEASHMGGADETEAVAWQEEFSAYFGARFGDLAADSVTDPTLKALSEARILLVKAQTLAKANPQDPHVFGKVGKIAEKLAELPDVQDPLALELKMQSPHPEFIDNYCKSVRALIGMMTTKFDLQHDVIKISGGLSVPVTFMQTEQIVPTLTQIEQALDQISENFLALTGLPTETR